MADMSWSGVERTGKLYLLSGTGKTNKRKRKRKRKRGETDRIRLGLAEGCCLGVGKGHWFGFRGGWVGFPCVVTMAPVQCSWHLLTMAPDHGTLPWHDGSNLLPPFTGWKHLTPSPGHGIMHCVPVCVWLPVVRPTHPTGLVHTSTLVPSRTTRCVAFACPFFGFFTLLRLCFPVLGVVCMA